MDYNENDISHISSISNSSSNIQTTSVDSLSTLPTEYYDESLHSNLKHFYGTKPTFKRVYFMCLQVNQVKGIIS